MASYKRAKFHHNSVNTFKGGALFCPPPGTGEIGLRVIFMSSSNLFLEVKVLFISWLSISPNQFQQPVI